MAHSCKDCEKRYVGCHAECESYQAFYQRNRERNAKRLKERQLNQDDRTLSNYYRKIRSQLP